MRTSTGSVRDLTGTGTETVTGTTRLPAERKRRRRAGRRAGFGRAWLRVKRQIRNVWRRVHEVITAAGWLVIGTVAVGIVLGLVFGWAEFLVAGVAATLLILLAIPFLMGGKGYLVSLVVERDRVTVGDPLPATVRVKNTRRAPTLPGSIDLPVGEGLVEVPIPGLSGGASTDQQVNISTVKRGIVDVGPPRVTKGDPLGLLRFERTWEDKRTVFIHPRTVQLPSTSTGFVRDLEGNPTARLVNDDLAFHAIREYAPGDAQRQIHWKSTAKTGQLMVRQYEETRRSEMLVALDVREESYVDEAEFELAVSAAASLGLRGIRDGRSLQVVTGAEIPPFAPTDSRGIERLRTVTATALLDDMSGVKWFERVSAIADVITQATERDDAVSIGLLVVGSKVGAREIRMAAMAMPMGVPVLAVVADSFGKPGLTQLADLTVLRIGIPEDLRHLMLRGVR